MGIVVAVDESKRTERVVDFSIKEAKLRGEKLFFIHSLFGGDKTTQEEIERGEKLLENAAKVAQASGVEYETHLLIRGREPGDDIVEFSNQVKAHLIIIGVRKRRPVGEVAIR